LGLFDELARRRIAVEINLSSNLGILGVAGREHPLRDYMTFGVPMVLATDDERVSRSDPTNEWVQAVRDHRLGYGDLVRMARDSLEYSFLGGDSLWDAVRLARREYRPRGACSGDLPLIDAISEGCRTFLGASEKAHRQWELERRLADFAALDWDGLRGHLTSAHAGR
jgi:hypothetical protein